MYYSEDHEVMDVVEGAAGSSGSTPRSPRSAGVVVRRQRTHRSIGDSGDPREGCSYAAAVSGKSFRPVQSLESRASRR